jgi:hypothetical protein
LRQLPSQSSLFDEVRSNGTVNNTQHLAHQFGAAGEQESKLVWEAEYPLTHWLVGQDFVHQQGRAFGHAPGATARTDKIAGSDFEPLSGPQGGEQDVRR